MAGPLARLYATLGLDAREFASGIQQAKGQIAGLGTTASAGLRIAAGAVGAGLAVAAKGALDMENRQAQFRAETGASADEAAAFGRELNAMAGNSLVPMNDLATAMTRIRTDLGLTGDAASTAASEYERYMRATNQGADAVLAFDDILDAWNLEAEDQAGIMDVLVKSHQLYGGSIVDNQRLLAQLAPTLQAVNMSWEEGQGLLNLFARAGISGEAAVTAFNRAISKVESPEELQQLLENISDTTDPFRRATLAIDLFGARAGTKLAQALADADGNLQAFMVTTDEAAGTVTDAAEAMDSTWTSRIQLMVNKGLSLLQGFGMQVGPVLTAAFSAASLGGMLGLDKLLAGAWTRVAASSVYKGAIAGAAGAAVKAYAAALIIGDKIAVMLSGVWSGISAAGSRAMLAVEAAGGAAAARYISALAKGLTIVGVGLVIEQAIEEGMRQAGIEPEPAISFNTGDWEKDLRSQFGDAAIDAAFGISEQVNGQVPDLFASAGGKAGYALGEGVEDGVKASAPGILSATGALGGPLMAQFRAIASGMPKAFDDAIEQTRQRITEGFGNIKSALANPPQIISRRDRIENMEGRQRKIFKRLHQAVQQDDPANQKYWTRAAIAQAAKLEKMRGNSGTSTAAIRKKFAQMGVNIEGTWLDTERQARSSSSRARSTAVSAAQATAAAVTAALSGIDLGAAGLIAGLTFARGLSASQAFVAAAAQALAQKVADNLKGSSPPKEGPMSTMDTWGMKLVEAWLTPIDQKGPDRVRKTVTGLAGAFTPGGSMGLPRMAAAGGGDTFQVGTLIADEGGLAKLDKRVSRVRRRRSRCRHIYNDTD